MAAVELDDVQGNLLRGYRMHYVAHVVTRIGDRSAAKRFIGAAASDDPDHPQVTSEGDGEWTRASKPATCLNAGITAAGLRALGLDENVVASFPHEFVAGPHERAVKVGDVGESGPENWHHGLDRPDAAHVLWSVHARDDSARRALLDELASRWDASGAFDVVSIIEGQALPDPHRADHTHAPGDPEPLGDVVHFGYRDSISQPRFEVNGRPVGKDNGSPPTPVGALLLGYPETSFANVQWDLPRMPPEVSRNGCFNAFRVLEQDVGAFEAFLERVAADRGWNKEFVAAKLMGRWRNGAPLVDLGNEAGGPVAYDYATDSEQPPVDEATINNWDYPDIEQGDHDLEGRPCPLGAHIRRANPRGSRIAQRSANRTRPIVRRGMPYGPPFDPDNPHDGERRGLLGNFFCGSLLAQYEALMYDWINLGLHDPRITGTNDPIIGANDPRTSRFDIRMDEQTTVSLRGFPRFVQTRGCLYLWMPSMRALRHLATAG